MEKIQLVYAASAATSGRNAAESNSYNGAHEKMFFPFVQRHTESACSVSYQINDTSVRFMNALWSLSLHP